MVLALDIFLRNQLLLSVSADHPTEKHIEQEPWRLPSRQAEFNELTD